MKTHFLFISGILLSTISVGQNVGINSTGATPNISAMLDIAATDKGILIPRITLTSTTLASPISTPAPWLFVFNTATVNDVSPGMYYWNTSKWVRVLEDTDGWKTSGNAGTIATTNFLGTTDNVTLRFRTNNTQRFEMNTNGQLLSFNLGSAIQPTFGWNNGGLINTGIYYSALNTIGFTTAGVNRFDMNSNGQIVSSSSGAPAAPTYSWQSDIGTGIYRSSAGIIGFSTASLNRFNMNANGQLLASSIGSTALPTFGWQSSPTTGIYSSSNGHISFASTGQTPVNITAVAGNNALLAVAPNNCSVNRGGVFGLNITPAGNGIDYNQVNYGVKGETRGGRNYSFGIQGYLSSLLVGVRSGGVLGALAGPGIWASLAYITSGSVNYGVYSNSTPIYSGGGYSSDNSANGIAYGGYSDFIGSIVNSEIIGTINTGKLMASYNIGNEYTSGYKADVVSTQDGSKEVVFTMSSIELKIYADGSAQLNNGQIFVPFKDNFKKMIAAGKSPNITATPMGECNGIYISKIEKDGFWVKEVNNGASSVQFSWIAIGERIDQIDIPADILKADFDRNISNIAPNENNPDAKGGKAYWNGKEIIFGQEMYIK